MGIFKFKQEFHFSRVLPGFSKWSKMYLVKLIFLIYSDADADCGCGCGSSMNGSLIHFLFTLRMRMRIEYDLQFVTIRYPVTVVVFHLEFEGVSSPLVQGFGFEWKPPTLVGRENALNLSQIFAMDSW